MSSIEILGRRDDVVFTDYDSIKTTNNGLSIHNNGKGNLIKIGRNVVFNNFNIRVNCNFSKIIIGDNCRLTGTVIMKLSDNNELVISDNTSIGGANFICGESSRIIIGEDCMIAWGIEFRTTDSHGIYDIETKTRLNIAKDIVIGNHVWIGAHSTILKGTNIEKGSVISIKSLVNSSFHEENVIVGGIPGKVIKKNIYWERELLG